LCESYGINLGSIEILLDPSPYEPTHKLNSMVEIVKMLKVRTATWAAIPRPKYHNTEEVSSFFDDSRLHLQMTIISCEYHLGNLNYVHKRSPLQSSLSPLSQLAKSKTKNCQEVEVSWR